MIHPPTFGFDQIAPGLFQGSAPQCGVPLRRFGFDAVVLAAAEHQLPDRCFGGGVEVHCVPLHDDPRPTMTQLQLAVQAARFAAARVAAGKAVLVTCWQGINRSGLVSALTLVLLGHEPALAVAQVQMCRPGALSNRGFVQALHELGSRLRRKNHGRERNRA